MRSVKYGVLAIFLLLVAQDLHDDVAGFIDDQSNLNPYQIVQTIMYMGVYSLAWFSALICFVTLTTKENKNEQKNSTRND